MHIFICLEIFCTFTNNVVPNEMPHYFIWVFTARKRNGLGVPCTQRVKEDNNIDAGETEVQVCIKTSICCKTNQNQIHVYYKKVIST